ncbi:MAG: RraA family protein [Rhodospirillales bacterium]|jgi:regulator of RNase E activity RraA|nr:RraA family protein [Rhodospirillales bacterium]MDP7623427.1 RraA family protein [Rhodospirillales bacterium]|tara:strand:- start:2397 stop:3050 length:654 start_codon:yes stop_codon:yes gene_type:complete
MGEEIIVRLNKLSTSTVSDAMDRLGIAGQCLGIKPVDVKFRLCGRAYTMRTVPAEVVAGSVGDYIDDVPAGAVVVIDNGGRQDKTVWGDILTFLAEKNGVAGTVIDGNCRDIHRCIEINYPVFSRGWSMRTGKDRVQLDQINIPVSIGDARVEPDDLLLGDADGVLAIPKEHEDRVVELAEEIEAAEEKIMEALRQGKKLYDARMEFKYHELQRRED